MDYIVVLDNEDEPNIETFREQCIFSVIRYDPDTKKATTQKTESMPIEVQLHIIRFAKTPLAKKEYRMTLANGSFHLFTMKYLTTAMSIGSLLKGMTMSKNW